jgi:arabinose-5-phosphate isomerase
MPTERLSWKESLERHMLNLEHMADNLDPIEVDDVLDTMRTCDGLILFTGVGQNLILATKVASTYNALSIRAMSVDPIASLHGTMGMFRAEDLLVAISKSGETFELLCLLRACREIGFTNTVGVHSARGCTLGKLSARSVYVPMVGEADHLNMAPTASSGCFLAFLQAIAVQLSSENGLTAVDFVRTHPGGTLGKRSVSAPPWG